MGNPNPVKFGRCIVELERLYGIRKGSAGSSDQNNLGGKSQKDLANDIGINDEQLRNYKKLTTLIPELQDLIQDKQLSATTGYKVWAKMSEKEQEKFFNEIGKDKISEMTQKETQKYIEEKRKLEEENKQLKELYYQEKDKKHYIQKDSYKNCLLD